MIRLFLGAQHSLTIQFLCVVEIDRANVLLQDDITVKHCTNAYMLVYIRDNEMSK